MVMSMKLTDKELTIIYLSMGALSPIDVRKQAVEEEIDIDIKVKEDYALYRRISKKMAERGLIEDPYEIYDED